MTHWIDRLRRFLHRERHPRGGSPEEGAGRRPEEPQDVYRQLHERLRGLVDYAARNLV